MPIISDKARLAELLRALITWSESGCNSEQSANIRALLKVSEGREWRRAVLQRVNLHRIFEQTSGLEESAQLYRLLRDITCSRIVQTQALEHGTLDRALLRCGSPSAVENAEISRAAMEFIANCISGDAGEASRDVVWSRLANMRQWFTIHPSAAATIMHLCCGLGLQARIDDLLREGNLRFLLSFAHDTPDPDTHSWLAWTLRTVALSRPAELVRVLVSEQNLVNESDDDEELCTVIAAEDDIILNETEDAFPMDFAVQLIECSHAHMRARVSALVKLARWTSQFALTPKDLAERVLTVLVTILRIPKPSPAEDLASDVLRVIANILALGEDPLKDHFRSIGGVQLLLNNTNLDPRHPAKREWALFAIRSACENNIETQQLIASLKPLSLDAPNRT